MKTFLTFLVESKNLHMTHLEDTVIFGGQQGVDQGLAFIKEMLKNKVDTKITLKADGCVHGDTVLRTNKGPKSIREIVELLENSQSISVLGKDLDSDIPLDKLTHVIGGCSKYGNKNWVELTLENGESIKLTEDHEVHTSNRGWVPAAELIPNDDVTEEAFIPIAEKN